MTTKRQTKWFIVAEEFGGDEAPAQTALALVAAPSGVDALGQVLPADASLLALRSATYETVTRVRQRDGTVQTLTANNVPSHGTAWQTAVEKGAA